MGIDMKTFLVVNDSTGAKQEMDIIKLKEFLESLGLPEFDTEVLCLWADDARAGDSTNLGYWGPYYFLCL